MKTASDFEAALGLPVGSVRVESNSDGLRVFSGPSEVVEISCYLWSLRCIIERRELGAAVNAGIAALEKNQKQVANARWNYCSERLSRNEWFVKNLRTWIGYTNRQMDKLFFACIELENQQ